MVTAIRETFEETGIRLQAGDFVDEYQANLEGWDTTFFLVRPTEVPKFRRLSCEGWVAWKPVSTILSYKPYYDYNKALFKCFGLGGVE